MTAGILHEKGSLRGPQLTETNLYDPYIMNKTVKFLPARNKFKLIESNQKLPLVTCHGHFIRPDCRNVVLWSKRQSSLRVKF